MAKVSITYTALNAPVEPITPQICDILTRYNNAASMEVFKGTYYDTRVAPGIGEATSLADFVAEAVAHPGIIAYLRKAVADGSFEFETDNPDDIVYWGELGPALENEGFVITVTDEENAG
jgi:hypothetical protein